MSEFNARVSGRKLAETAVEKADISDLGRLIVLLALAGDEEGVRSLLAGNHVIPPERSLDDDQRSGEVFLESIRVEGFRGIGAQADLNLTPFPGLTVIVGRNGSGKSSFAEALEHLLTGRLQRLENATGAFRGGLRHVGWTGDVKMEAKFAVTGFDGGITRNRVLPVGANETALAQMPISVRDGHDLPISDLGWEEAARTWRPVLSTSEIAGLSREKPTEIATAVLEALSLEELVKAEDLLRQIEVQVANAVDRVEAGCSELLAVMEGHQDERAKQCQALLRHAAWAWDISAIEGLVSGESADSESPRKRLHAVRALALPTADEVDSLVSEVRAAADAQMEAATEHATHAESDAILLQHILERHAEYEDESCPLCGKGVLDRDWWTEAQERLADLSASASRLKEARQRTREAETDLRQALKQVPSELDGLPALDLNVATVVAAWKAWSAETENLDAPALAKRFEERLPGVRSELARVQESVTRQLAMIDEAWSPVAKRLNQWTDEVQRVAPSQRRLPDLQAAAEWIARTSAAEQKARFEEIADAAEILWERLRAESVVSLKRLALGGRQKQRKVGIETSINGDKAPLGVLSQGEMNAMALSLYLPRAFRSESPLRFVVIDDPAQGMDPSKVDGLAQYLETVATKWQIVVFVHDNVLPRALRIRDIPARIVHLSRIGGRIETNEENDPVERSLKDASVLAQMSDLSPLMSRHGAPVMLREAVEIACEEVFLRRSVTRGKSLDEAYESLDSVSGLRESLCLAIGDQAPDVREIGQWLRKNWGPELAGVFERVKSGSHTGRDGAAIPGDVKAVRNLIQKVKSLA